MCVYKHKGCVKLICAQNTLKWMCAPCTQQEVTCFWKTELGRQWTCLQDEIFQGGLFMSSSLEAHSLTFPERQCRVLVLGNETPNGRHFYFHIWNYSSHAFVPHRQMIDENSETTWIKWLLCLLEVMEVGCPGSWKSLDKFLSSSQQPLWNDHDPLISLQFEFENSISLHHAHDYSHCASLITTQFLVKLGHVMIFKCPITCSGYWRHNGPARADNTSKWIIISRIEVKDV